MPEKAKQTVLDFGLSSPLLKGSPLTWQEVWGQINLSGHLIWKIVNLQIFYDLVCQAPRDFLRNLSMGFIIG